MDLVNLFRYMFFNKGAIVLHSQYLLPPTSSQIYLTFLNKTRIILKQFKTIFHHSVPRTICDHFFVRKVLTG